MADSELIVRLRGENADLKSKLKEVTDASKTSASGMASSFKSALGGIASAIGITFSAKVVVDFAKQSVQAFAETERAASSLRNVISNMGGSAGQGSGMVEMADSLERMSGFDDADIMSAMQELIVETGSESKATLALNVALDMAAARHMTLNEAQQKVFQVMSGLTRTMRTFGMTARDDATDMDYLRELGSKMAGGLSTNMDTLDGKFRMATNSVDNFKEAIGTRLRNAVSNSSSWITQLFNSMSDNINIEEGLKSVFGDTATVPFMEELGLTYGKSWLKGYVEAMTGGGQGHDVGWVGTVVPTTDFGTTAADANADLQSKFYSLTHSTLQISLKSIDTQVAAYRAAGADEVSIAKWAAAARVQAYKTAADAAKGTANTITDAFKAAWQPISLMGGNTGELTKYIGNLRQTGKVTLSVEVEVKGSGAKLTKPDAKKVADAVAPVVAAAVTHGSGWSPARQAI